MDDDDDDDDDESIGYVRPLLQLKTVTSVLMAINQGKLKLCNYWLRNALWVRFLTRRAQNRHLLTYLHVR